MLPHELSVCTVGTTTTEACHKVGRSGQQCYRSSFYIGRERERKRRERKREMIGEISGPNGQTTTTFTLLLLCVWRAYFQMAARLLSVFDIPQSRAGQEFEFFYYFV